MPLFRQWAAHVNRPESEADLTALHNRVRRGIRTASGRFVTQSAARLQHDHTISPQGSPQKIESIFVPLLARTIKQNH
jgi:hypothetical protein